MRSGNTLVSKSRYGTALPVSSLTALMSETTRSAIAGGLKALIEHPDQLARLRSDPGMMKSAIEEIVRWTTPSIYKRRTATRDVVFGGKSFA